MTEQDVARMELGETWFDENGGGNPMEEVLAEFGLTTEDYPFTEEKAHLLPT